MGLSLETVGSCFSIIWAGELCGKIVWRLKAAWKRYRLGAASHRYSGRKPEVHIDPHMDIIEALRRRDLTMNAMAIEIGTATLIDPFHGLQDHRKKTVAVA